MALEDRLGRRLLASHPDHAARVLEELPADQAAALLDAVPETIAATVLGQLERARLADYLQRTSPQRRARLAGALPTGAATVALRTLGASERERLLADLHPPDRQRLERMLSYAADSAGALMDSAVLAFPEDLDSATALKRARREGGPIRFYVYVTDRDHRLVGVLSLRELMRAPGSRSVGEIATRPVQHLRANDPRETIAAHLGWRSLHALPVIDDAGTLVGLVPYETFRRIEAELPRDQRPDLVMLGSAMTQSWAGLTALLLEGLGRGWVASAPLDAAGSREDDDG